MILIRRVWTFGRWIGWVVIARNLVGDSRKREGGDDTRGGERDAHFSQRSSGFVCFVERYKLRRITKIGGVGWKKEIG